MEPEMDDYTKIIATILKAAQEKNGPSYTQLAKRTGLGRATVERVLNGKREITAKYLRLLCAELGLVPSQVVDEADKTV